MKKRLIITSLISIILVCILLLGSTYSIFTTGDIDENANVYTTGNLDVTYTLSDDNIKITDITPINVDDSIRIRPYRIRVTNNGNVAYKFNVILNDTSLGEKIDYRYIMTQVGKLEPISFDNCSDNIIKGNVVVLAGDSVDIDVRVWLDDSIKNSEIGKSFYAKISIAGIATYDSVGVDNSDLIADRLSLASSYVEDLYNDGSVINDVYIGGDSTNPVVSLNATRGIMLDNNGEYRYYGKSPDNYVNYNNELYRIISVSNVKSDDSGKNGELRLKIVRDEYLDKVMDYGVNNNDYSISDISKYLNEYYYNNFSVSAKEQIDNALYYLGAVSGDNYSNDIYEEERGNKICNGCNDRKTNWVGKIGLIYPSDYMYATDLSLCTSSFSKYDEDSCVNNNWLVGDNELTISSGVNNVGDIVFIHNGGLSMGIDKLKIRPVLYLKSSVSIVSGNGTRDNPYVLDIVD